MKIIDLFNKIANGEEVPEKFKFAGQIFEKQGSYIEDGDGDSIFDSMCTDFSNINEEVEIIEENKKIEKLNDDNFGSTYAVFNKINEIIDKVNELEDKENGFK